MKSYLVVFQRLMSFNAGNVHSRFFARFISMDVEPHRSTLGAESEKRPTGAGIEKY